MTKRKANMSEEPTGKSARVASSEKKPCTQKQLKTQESGDTTASSLATTKEFPSGSKSFEQKLKNLAYEADGKKNADQQASSAKDRSMPSNSELEALITTLESNDTYKIFAEPVDRRKVPGYYRRIREPMDFSTLRGKLQKGLYTNMDQFERDVYLIFNNAMMINPPTTIFYKEASNLQALALKEFVGLKLNHDMVKFNDIVRSVEKNCSEQEDTKTGIVKASGLNASEPSAGKVSPPVGQISSGNASTSIGQSSFGKASPSVGQSSSGKANPSVGRSSSGIASPSVGRSSAGIASPSVGQLSSGTYMGRGDIISTHGSPNGRNVNFSSNDKPQTQMPRTPLNQTSNTASEVCHVTKEPLPVSFIPDRLQQNPLGYKAERINTNSSMPEEERFGNVPKELAVVSSIPDRVQQNPPGYNGEVIDIDSNMAAHDGHIPTLNMSTMQGSDSNSRRPDKGKKVASAVHSDKTSQPLPYGRPVMLSSPLVQNAGNENLQICGEQLPGPGAMMQPEAQLTSTYKPCYIVEVINLNSSMPRQQRFENASTEFGPLSFLPDWLRESQPGYDVLVINRDSIIPGHEGPGSTSNKSTMHNSDFNARKLDKGKKSASTLHSDKTSKPYDQPVVVLSPHAVQNAGNVNSEKLPDHGAMTYPEAQLMSTYQPGYNVEVINIDPTMPAEQGHCPTRNISTMQQSRSSSRKLDKGKKFASTVHSDKTSQTLAYGEPVMLSPPQVQYAGNANLQLNSEQLPDHGAMMKPEVQLISTDQPGYNVEVVNVDPTVPAQKGRGPTRNIRTMQKSGSNSRKLDKGKKIASTVHYAKTNQPLAYGEPVLMSPPQVQYVRNANLQLNCEQLPGHGAMMQPEVQLISTDQPGYNVEVANVDPTVPSGKSHGPTRNISTMQQSCFNSRKLDKGKKIASTMYYDKTSLPLACGQPVMLSPQQVQYAGNANLQLYGKQLPGHGAMMQPEAQLTSTYKPCYIVEVVNHNSNMPREQRLENASTEFGPISFLPDWLRESQPTYDVQVINGDSSIYAQEGPGSTCNKSTMHKSDFNSRKLDKGKTSASTVHSDKTSKPSAYGQPVVLSPPVIQNAGNENLQLYREQLPGHGAMTRPQAQLMTTYQRVYNVEVMNVDSTMPAEGGHGPTRNISTMQQSRSNSRKLDKGKKIASTMHSDKTSQPLSYSQPVMVSPPQVPYAGNVNLQLYGKQLPGHGAMMQPAERLISTNQPGYNVEVMNVDPKMLAEEGHGPTRNIHNMHQSPSNSRKLDKGKKIASIVQSDKTRQPFAYGQPPLVQNTGNANLQLYGKELPDYGAMMQPEAHLISTNRPCYTVEVIRPNSSMPRQEGFQKNSSNEFGPVDFLPDWLRQDQPGYKVQVIVRDSSIPAQEGSGSTWNPSTMQQSNSSDSNSRKLDKGKKIASAVHYDNTSQSIPYGRQPVMLSPPLDRDAGNANLRHYHMMQPHTELISTPDAQNAGSSPINFWTVKQHPPNSGK